MKKNISKLVGDKGFTIIELIVVVAIIAILATIVLINVNNYISKSRDSAIKADIHTLQVDAASNFGTYGNYYIDGDADNGSFCSADANDAWTAITTNLQKGSGLAVCHINSDATAFCACVRELADTSKYFCVDSTGKAEETSTNCLTSICATGTTDVACPSL